MNFIVHYDNLCESCNHTIAQLAEALSIAGADTDDNEAPLMKAYDREMLCGGKVCARHSHVVEICGRIDEPEQEWLLDGCWWFIDKAAGLFIFDPHNPWESEGEHDVTMHGPSKELWYSLAERHEKDEFKTHVEMLAFLKDSMGREVEYVPRLKRKYDSNHRFYHHFSKVTEGGEPC